MSRFIQEGKVSIVAEMAQSYEGSQDVAEQIAIKACRAGVDAVMFQVVYADELAVPQNNRYSLFRNLEMPKNNWKRIIDTVHAAQGMAFGEIFGKRSADVVLEGGIDGFKIHAADLSNLGLLRYVGQTNLPTLLSVGGCTEEEVRTAVQVMQDSGSEEIILMHGYQLCPTSLDCTHVLKIPALKERFGFPVGYGDHIAGCVEGDVSRMNPLALTIPLLAIGAGAKVIEKHVILNRTRAWEDYESALTPEEFVDFVTLIRSVEMALGDKSLAPNDAESAYRTSAKKYIVAANDIAAETILKEEHILFKRIEKPEEGIVNPFDVLGRKLRYQLHCNDVITLGSLVQEEG